MHAGTRDPEIDVRSFPSGRVQLVIEAHLASGLTIDPERPGLREFRGRRRMPPTIDQLVLAR